MANSSNAFAADHPIEMIRGLNRPGRATVLRCLAQRAAWLSNRMELDARTNVRDAAASLFMCELKSLAIAVESFERVRQLEREIAKLQGTPLPDSHEGRFADRLGTAITKTRDKMAEKLALKERAR